MEDYLKEDLRSKAAASGDYEEKKRAVDSRGVLLLQDNAQAHTSQVAISAATKYCFEVFP